MASAKGREVTPGVSTVQTDIKEKLLEVSLLLWNSQCKKKESGSVDWSIKHL